MITPNPNFVILVILDGWGIASEGPGNAITKANTVNMNRFWSLYPHTELEASGEAVGLPGGEDGNTETGHLNLGAGKIVYQDLQRINMAIEDESFYKNEVLHSAIQHTKNNNSALHLMGLVGGGGVHSKVEHLYALIKLAKSQGVANVYIHVFTDGRDSPQMGGINYVSDLQSFIAKEGVGEIVSIMGRYWAMDRDQRWDRTAKAYEVLTKGIGDRFKNVEDAIKESYQKGITDEFITPTIITDNEGNPKALISSNDAVVFFNFRIDRPRQLTKAFVFSELTPSDMTFDFKPLGYTRTNHTAQFVRDKKLENLFFVTMTDYGKQLVDAGAKPAFPPEIVSNPLSSVISESGFPQLKITESEKERFVTFYFNGLREKPYPLEKSIIIPSQKVATYDQMPQMSAEQVTATVLEHISKSTYKFFVVNFPNADMVGHTGNIGAAVSAIETVDTYVGKIANYVLAYNGVMIITADHGNAEEMINLETGDIDTEHSINRVPFIVVSKDLMGKSYKLRSGILADVAPTILHLLKIPVPGAMTGKNLLEDVMGV